MANNPLTPPDDGKIKLPAIQAGMNKRGPTASDGGKGGDDGEWTWLGRQKFEEKDVDILARARSRFERTATSEAENRKRAEDDLKFRDGQQWPQDVAAQRNMDKRPCLTINKLNTFVHLITNDIRMNRPAMNVSPVGERGDKEAAKMFRGLIRHIERASAADIAYDTATDNQVTNGFGYIRLLLDWESPDSFHQVLRIGRVRNPFTVYLDPDRQQPDGSDSRFGFVTEVMPLDEFKALWPDLSPSSYDLGAIGDKWKEWSSKDGIRVCEYYEITHETRTLVELDNGFTGWADELDEKVKDSLKAKRLTYRRKREAQYPKVMHYKLTAIDILEREEWIGSHIPIVPVIGDEIDIGGKVSLRGVVRDAKGPQQMYNYWRTSETELVALAPKAPYIVEEGQIEGHERQWKAANTRSFPYLSYKATSVGGRPAPPPQRQPPPQIPAGVVQAAQSAAQDMMATTGIRFDATMQERMTDESGRAIRELRRTSDIGAFHYADNLNRSLRWLGEQLLEAIPKVYDEERVVTILREDDQEEQIKINPAANAAYGEQKRPDDGPVKIFNPKIGKYGVTVTIGESYATKRIEAAEQMMAFVKALPNTAAMVADLIAAEMDWPGAEKIASRLAKAIDPKLLTPDQKDISPQVQALIQSLETQVKMLQGELQQALAAVKDKSEDRDIAREKITADFEAKILAIVQKAEAERSKQENENLRAVVQHVKDLTMHLMPKPQEPEREAGEEPDENA